MDNRQKNTPKTRSKGLKVDSQISSARQIPESLSLSRKMKLTELDKIMLRAQSKMIKWPEKFP